MKEIPYSVICAAQNGDTDAIALIRRHFEGYIASKCLVTYDDGDGHSCTFPDDELRYLAEAALYAAQSGMTPDAVVMDAEGAIAALGEITGETVTDAVVTRIFSDFCVGK